MKTFITRKIRRLREEIQYLDITSRPRKILFDHLPKCGGTTLIAYLESHYLSRKTFSTDGRNPRVSVGQFKAFSRYKRHGYDLVAGHLANELLDYVHPECLKVTVFRDPVERIVSHYYYAKREPKHYLHSRILESDMSLEDYATSGLSNELRNWYTTHFSRLTVSDAERNQKESIAKAVEAVLNRYDVIGFLDEFVSFTKVVRSQAKLRHEYQNNRSNVTQDRPYLKDISQSTIRKIKELNYLDIAFYEEIKKQ